MLTTVESTVLAVHADSEETVTLQRIEGYCN